MEVTLTFSAIEVGDDVIDVAGLLIVINRQAGGINGTIKGCVISPP